jgi:hypothetical protein
MEQRQKHMEEFDIDGTDEEHIRDENLDQHVALRVIQDVDDEEAKNVETDIMGLATHTGCRIRNLYEQHPEEPETDIWNGVTVSGLLYPYESNFSPRDYEQTAQEVISVGNQIDEAMKKLDIMEDIEYEP